MSFQLFATIAKMPAVALCIFWFIMSVKSGFLFGINDTPGSQGAKKVIVQIIDETGKMIGARVITQYDTEYFAPDGHSKDFIVSETGGDVMLDKNRLFAYVI